MVVVNGDPITTMDIANRSKLIQLTTRKTPPRQEVVDELIDEKLKVIFAKRYRLEASDTDVEAAYADMARRMRNTRGGTVENLVATGCRLPTRSRIAFAPRSSGSRSCAENISQACR